MTKVVGAVGELCLEWAGNLGYPCGCSGTGPQIQVFTTVLGTNMDQATASIMQLG